MKQNGLGTIVLLILLLSLNAQNQRISGDEVAAITLKGTSSYSTQLDARTGKEISSFSYSLQVDNGGDSPTSAAVRLVFHDIEADSVQTFSPAIRLVKSIDLGRFVECTFNVTAPPGRSTFEISAKPRAMPFLASQSLIVNGEPANVTVMGPYRYVSINAGDLLIWKVKVTNQFWNTRSMSVRLQMPLLLSLSLDTTYFEIVSMNPAPNSTKEGKENQWNLMLEDSAEIELKIKVTKLSEWGIAKLSPFIISYSSETLVSFLEMMKGRASSLRASADLLETVLKSANSSIGLVGGIADQLDIASNAMVASGVATAEVGNALLMIAQQANGTASAIGALLPQLDLLLQLTSSENLSAIISQAKSNIDSTIATLQNLQNTLSTQAGVLLQLNTTLNTLLNQTSNPEQRGLILSSIAMTESVYDGISGSIPLIQDAIASLDEMKTILDQIDLSEVHGALLNYSISVNQLYSGMKGMSSALSEVGGTMLSVARTGFDQFRYLSNLSALLRESTNATADSMTDLDNSASEARAAADRLDSDIRNAELEKERLSYLSPETATKRNEPLKLLVTEDDTLNHFLKSVSNESTFVKYLAFNSTSALEIWNLTGGNPVKVTDFSSLGIWRSDGSFYIPIFSSLDVNEVGFDWSGRFPMKLVLAEGYEVTIYYRNGLGNQTELFVATLLQPDFATEVSPASIIPTEPEKPPTGELRLLSPQALTIASYVVLAAAIVAIYFWNSRKKRSIAREQERLKRIEERRKLRADSESG